VVPARTRRFCHGHHKPRGVFARFQLGLRHASPREKPPVQKNALSQLEKMLFYLSERDREREREGEREGGVLKSFTIFIVDNRRPDDIRTWIISHFLFFLFPFFFLRFIPGNCWAISVYGLSSWITGM